MLVNIVMDTMCILLKDILIGLINLGITDLDLMMTTFITCFRNNN